MAINTENETPNTENETLREEAIILMMRGSVANLIQHFKDSKHKDYITNIEIENEEELEPYSQATEKAILFLEQLKGDRTSLDKFEQIYFNATGILTQVPNEIYNAFFEELIKSCKGLFSLLCWGVKTKDIKKK